MPLTEFPKRIRVEADVQASMLVEKIVPARAPQSPGTVRLSVVVGKDGTVLEAQPLAGPDDLSALAIDAVKQWKYRPTTLNGRPVETQSTVELFVA